MNNEYTLQDDIKERLADSGFKKAWDESEVEYLLATKLTQIRKARNMSQRELAKKANTSQAHISSIETMGANPSLGTLKKISNALQVTLTVGFE